MYDRDENRSSTRNSRRFDFLSNIEYSLDSPTARKVHKGMAINISNRGMAAYVFSPHCEGQTIIIKSSLPVEPRIAIVRWVKQEEEDVYLTGLHFSDHTCRS